MVEIILLQQLLTHQKLTCGALLLIFILTFAVILAPPTSPPNSRWLCCAMQSPVLTLVYMFESESDSQDEGTWRRHTIDLLSFYPINNSWNAPLATSRCSAKSFIVWVKELSSGCQHQTLWLVLWQNAAVFWWNLAWSRLREAINRTCWVFSFHHPADIQDRFLPARHCTRLCFLQMMWFCWLL